MRATPRQARYDALRAARRDVKQLRDAADSLADPAEDHVQHDRTFDEMIARALCAERERANRDLRSVRNTFGGLQKTVERLERDVEHLTSTVAQMRRERDATAFQF